MTLSFVAALADNNVIGRDNRLPSNLSVVYDELTTA